MPLYDFPKPFQGINEGISGLTSSMAQAQQMRGQGMQNQLYQMQLGEKQQDIARQAELERRLQGLPSTATGQDIEQAYSGVYPVKGAEMRINKEQERLKIKLGTWKELITTYKDNPEMLNQLLEMGNTDPEIGALGITGIKAVDSGIELTQEREYPANAFGQGSPKGKYKVTTTPGKPKKVEMIKKQIDKTIDLGDKVRIVYTDGTTKDEKKGVSPSTDSVSTHLLSWMKAAEKDALLAVGTKQSVVSKLMQAYDTGDEQAIQSAMLAATGGMSSEQKALYDKKKDWFLRNKTPQDVRNAYMKITPETSTRTELPIVKKQNTDRKGRAIEQLADGTWVYAD